MTTSSARPANLADFKTRTSSLDADVAAAQAKLSSAYSSFQSANRWGGIDASGLLTNVATFDRLNRADARWVAGVGEAFAAADASGDVAHASSGQITASLQAAGIPSSGRADIQVAPSVAQGGLQSSGYADDPVSAASGNFIEVEVDLAFGPALADLQLRRTYNSRDTADGGFGRGWSSWASTRLRVDASGEWADWRGPDGQAARIELSVGTCPGFEGRIEADGDGMVAEFPNEQMFWRFDAEGRPSETWRGAGTRLNLGWDGQRLVVMTHERGRSVTLEWDERRIIGAVADDGRRVDYRYDDGGHLVGVDGPMGARRYEIDDAGRIASVTDADGVVVATNTYDSLGRVLTQRSEFGRLTRFRYEDGLVTVVDDDSGGPTNRYEHTRNGQLLKATDGHGQVTSRAYDARGRVVGVTDRNGATTRYEWDEADRQVAIVDPEGVRIDTTYDDLGRAVSVSRGPATTRFEYPGESRTPHKITDPEGGVTRFEVVDGQITAAVDPDGVRVELGYDEQGRVKSATDPLGGVRTFEWDVAGQLSASSTPEGRRTAFERDAAGRVVRQTLPGGSVWQLERTPAGRVSAVVDPAGGRRVLERGEHGRVVAETDPVGARTTARWDSFGNIEARVTAEGGKWEYSYDSLMRIVGVSDPSGSTWLREFDAEGNQTATITPEGVRRSSLVDGTGRIVELDDGVTSARFDYDDLGRPIAQIRPDGSTVTGSYDLNGQLVSLTEATGGTSTFEYTRAGRLAALVGPEGGRVVLGYDPAGRLVTVTDANGATRTLGLDGDGLVTSVTEATGEVTGYRYDPDGRLLDVTAPNGGVTRYGYDALGRVSTVTDPTGGLVSYSYDPAGRISEVTDPNGATIGFERDLMGRVIADTDPTGATTRYRLDEMGRILERTDPLGRTSAMTYDSSGRLATRIDADGRRWSWSYDASDRLSAYSVGDYRVTIGRDSLARPTQVVDNQGVTVERAFNADGSLTGEIVTTPVGTTVLGWTYDRAGRRTAWTANGATSEATLDAAGRVTRIDDPAGGAIELTRDPAGRLVGIGYGGHAETRTYRDGQLVRWAGTDPDNPVAAVDLERDASGRIVAHRATDPGGARAVTNAAYDDAGQLVQLATDADDWTFTYDGAGRLTEEAGPAGTVCYAYDQAAQLTEVARSDASTTIEWDRVGRRTGESTTDGSSRSYGYGLSGRLASITSTGSDGSTNNRSLTHDPLGRVAAIDETTLGWDPTGPLTTLRTVGDSRLIGAASPLGVAGPGSDEVSWFGRDHRGTANPSDPFGSGQAPNPLLAGLGIGHTGGLSIDDQLWLGQRLYDPASRAFTTYDPLPGIPGWASASNPYHYNANDPLNRSDLTGRQPIDDAQLDQIRSDWHNNAWDRYGGYVVGGLMIAGGIALIATGVGSPIAAGMLTGALLGGGMSAATQEYSGDVDWGKVGVDTVIGGVAGGVGGAAGQSVKGLATVARSGPITQGAIVGATDSVAGGVTSRTLSGENPLDPQGMAVDLFTGGGTGAAAGALSRPSSTIEQVSANTPPPTAGPDVDLPHGGADFVAGPAGSGPPVATDQSRMVSDFDTAGLPSEAVPEGTRYTLPDSSQVTVADPAGGTPSASFTDANGARVDPFSGQQPTYHPHPKEGLVNVAGWGVGEGINQALDPPEPAPFMSGGAGANW